MTRLIFIFIPIISGIVVSCHHRIQRETHDPIGILSIIDTTEVSAIQITRMNTGGII